MNVMHEEGYLGTDKEIKCQNTNSCCENHNDIKKEKNLLKNKYYKNESILEL